MPARFLDRGADSAAPPRRNRGHGLQTQRNSSTSVWVLSRLLREIDYSAERGTAGGGDRRERESRVGSGREVADQVLALTPLARMAARACQKFRAAMSERGAA